MKLILTLLLAAATLSLTAQTNRGPVVYKQAISLSPLALADIDHTVMLTGEYRPNPKVGLLVDAGYIFASEYRSNIKRTAGFNIRPAVRMYHGRRNRGYLQAQAFYKMADYTLNDWIGKDCVDGVPAYQKLEDFTYRKNVMGFNIIAGGVLPLSPSHKWLVDLYGGLGFRSKKHKVVNEPDGCYDLNTGGFFNFEVDGTSISLPMGVRITHVIK